MSRTRIVVLMVVVLALVAIGHHQLAQLSNNVLNTSFIPEAQATSTPTPTPTPTATPTPTPTPTPAPIGESCTPGFYKTPQHASFVNGGSCVAGVSGSTPVSTIFGSVGSSCVYNMTLVGLLNSPASACGAGTPAQAQLNLMRQAITAWLNATTSDPSACSAAAQIVVQTDLAIVAGAASEGLLQNSFEDNINNDKIGRCAEN